jgi:hypothetical protein
MSFTFKEFIKEETIEPSTEPGTMSFWHGGNLETPFNSLRKQKISRGEWGFGLYLTTHYGTAKKYAKGTRKFYMITVKKGTCINDVMLPIKDVEIFIDGLLSKSKATEAKQYVNLQMSANDTINAETLSNIMVNHEYLKASNTPKLKEFFLRQGIDYNIISSPFGWGEKMLVLFNMDLIVKKQIIKPNDKIKVFDLPVTLFNELK